MRKHHHSSEMVFPEGSWPAPRSEREGGFFVGPPSCSVMESLGGGGYGERSRFCSHHLYWEEGEGLSFASSSFVNVDLSQLPAHIYMSLRVLINSHRFHCVEVYS